MIEFKYVEDSLYKTSTPNTEVSMKINDSDIGEIVENFRSFLLAIGYHPDTVKEFVPGDEEIEEIVNDAIANFDDYGEMYNSVYDTGDVVHVGDEMNSVDLTDYNNSIGEVTITYNEGMLDENEKTD